MEIICIYTSDDEVEIESIKNQLEDNGIPTLVKNLYTQNLFGGIKLFSGHDPIAGSIQIYVRQDEVKKSAEILGAMGIDIPEFPEDTNSSQHESDESEPMQSTNDVEKGEDIVRKISYPIYLLTALSFLVIPFLVNIPLLISVGRTRKTVAIMMGIVGGMMAIAGGYFIVRSIIGGWQ